MDFLSNLELGLLTAVSLENLGYAFLGCLLGTIIGVLPGLGPVPTIAMLLPITYSLSPTAALIMLAGIYYGAQYGGSTTAILLRLPGESSSVVTLQDGYAMAQKGRAGPALSAAAIGSFFAGTVGVLLLAVFAQPLTDIALAFGPADYFALMLFGLVASVALTSEPLDRSLAMIIVGVLLGLVGTDVNSGAQRFTFGSLELMDGIEFACIAMGMFGITEIVTNLEERRNGAMAMPVVGHLWPSATDRRRMVPAILRGTGVGALLGVLPGAGATIASFAAYTLEKRVSRHRDEIGKGAIEGVASPESANNAAAQCNFIPLLTLGIPGSATMALLIGAMMIHDIQPGPQVISSQPALFWGLVVSMWIGNIMLLILNLPLISIWVALLKIPYRLLYPAIVVFCCVGAYTLKNSAFDILLVGVLGIVGYVFAKLRISTVPLLLGYVLGPQLETTLRRTLMISRGDYSIFATSPISATLLAITAGLLLWALRTKDRKNLGALET
jgi:putative tricarboxylic transport membrane protein